MKEFMFVFRNDFSGMPKGTPEEAAARTKRWMDWIASIAAENKLADRGKRLESSGKVLRANNVITNGPYSEIKESIGGYSIVKADSYEAAVELAKDCPMLTVGGNVEIREISVL